MKKIRIQVTSHPNRENLVAELWLENEHIGEVIHEGPGLQFIVYPRPNGKPWDFDLDDFLAGIAEARSRLSDD